MRAQKTIGSKLHLLQNDQLRHDERYLELFENLRDGVVTVDYDGNIVSFNSAYERLTGYSSQELLTMKYSDITPDKWHNFERHLIEEQVLKKGYSGIYQKEYRHKNGTVFPIELQTYLIRDSLGNPIGMQGVVRDISERVRAEKALKASEEKYRAVLSTARDGIILLDQDQKIAFVNDHLEEMLGYERSELIGLSPELLFYERDKEATRERLKQRRAGLYEKYEIELPTKRGNPIWVLISSAPLFGGEKTFTGSFSMFTDITYLKVAETDMRISKEIAENESRIKSQFINIAAHELRTPLTSVKMLIQLLLKKLSDADLRTFVEKIERQIDRLKILVNELLDVSQLEREGFPIKREKGNIVSIIQETVSDFQTSTQRDIVYEGRPSPVLVNFDPVRIYQVMSNLLDNAVKYSPGNRLIKVGLEDHPQFVQVSITDFGAGIDAIQKKKLFSKFYRAEARGKMMEPGLGLGLYICKRIIDLHGGAIYVKSKPPEGSTFFFTIPKA